MAAPRAHEQRVLLPQLWGAAHSVITLTATGTGLFVFGFLFHSPFFHQLPYKLVGHAYPQTPRRTLLDNERLASGGFLQHRIPRLSVVGEGCNVDERQHRLEEPFGEEEVVVAELELVVEGERWDLLADEKGIGTAHHVLRELGHEVRNIDGTVVDPNDPIGIDELDGGPPLGVVKTGDVVAQQVETPWNHV
ncbi:hypothetical protein V6N13_111993 [Hibiscus sabdariffa]|uniref:Uncharacterized protein n=1 Tax=Hibiscus sabdariffa TaxID=183260 RepID=A0ABR2TM85_9ROSI